MLRNLKVTIYQIIVSDKHSYSIARWNMGHNDHQCVLYPCCLAGEKLPSVFLTCK